MINYSLLTTDNDILRNSSQISNMLSQGIKVLAFGSKTIMAELQSSYKPFLDARLLQTFILNRDFSSFSIVDGLCNAEHQNLLKQLAASAPDFNLEQYQIEHADAYNSLIVEAGAGTGKTTVMIDRILFLLHTVPDLALENIGMITFTNEATQNMKHKIQKALMDRYLATHSPKYLQYLEESAKIQIQTIHSFSRDIINELGASIGYANTIGLKSFKYQKQQIIHDVLNQEFLTKKQSVDKSLGAKLHDLDALILSFWTQLENIGLTDEEIASLDWGLPADEDSLALHTTLSTSFAELNRRYNELKMSEDSIAVGDIVRELRRILDTGAHLEIKCKNLKYLFVDEFQDSDNAQIKTIAWLQKNINLILFAVGDVKQSIYRFRGAVETSFDKLRNQLAENGAPQPSEFTLVRNYRTSEDVLTALDPLFRNWEQQKLLRYGSSLSAQKKHAGCFHCSHVRNSEAVYSQEAVRKIQELLEDCKRDAKQNHREDDPSQHVTVLTRTNFQLSKVGQWCRDAHIPCYIQKEGTFYSSAAVRDFYCLVKGFLFPASAVHLFDFINSAYSCMDCTLEEIQKFAPASKMQTEYLTSILLKQGWASWQKEFRLKPVLSVLLEVVDSSEPVRRYIEKRRQILLDSEDWAEDDIDAQLEIDAKQYEADLEKLLIILRTGFSGQMVSLYQIYNFLQVQFLTNKTEDEPDISGETGCSCVYGMTVHKAKGLEFDTVFIPLTQRQFRKEIDTELLLDEQSIPHKVGWSKVTFGNGWNQVDQHKHNNYYTECLQKEFNDVDREEARLLYVALTRSIRRLECFIIGGKDHSWAQMLEV